MPPKQKRKRTRTSEKPCDDKKVVQDTSEAKKDYSALMSDPGYVDMIIATDLFMALKKAKQLLPKDTPQYTINYKSKCSKCNRETVLITSSLNLTYCSLCSDDNIPCVYPSV